MYNVTKPNLYRGPKRPNSIDLGGDAVQGQPQPSPKGSIPSLPPLHSVPSIGITLENCPASASPTLIEQSEHHDEGNDYVSSKDALYVIFPFDWCVPYPFELCGASETQTRKSITAIIQLPTPPPSLSSLSTVSKFRPPLPAGVVGFKREFVDEDDTSDHSINLARRTPHFLYVFHLILLHIKH